MKKIDVFIKADVYNWRKKFQLRLKINMNENIEFTWEHLKLILRFLLRGDSY